MDHECVNYWGHVGKAGYGLDYEPKTQKTISAHRKTHIDFFGPIEKGLVVMHTCNNKKCVNPLHLKLGTQAENVKQAYRDGLQVNPHRSLSSEKVLAIWNDTRQLKVVAKEHEVTKTIVRNIRCGKTYRDLTGGGTCGS